MIDVSCIPLVTGTRPGPMKILKCGLYLCHILLKMHAVIKGGWNDIFVTFRETDCLRYHYIRDIGV